MINDNLELGDDNRKRFFDLFSEARAEQQFDIKAWSEMYLRWLRAKRDFPGLDLSWQEPDPPETYGLFWFICGDAIKETLKREFDRCLT